MARIVGALGAFLALALTAAAQDPSSPAPAVENAAGNPAQSGGSVLFSVLSVAMGLLAAGILWKLDLIRPGSMNRPGDRPAHPPASVLAAAAFALFLLQGVFAAIGFGVASGIADERSRQAIATTVIYVGLLIAAWAVLTLIPRLKFGPSAESAPDSSLQLRVRAADLRVAGLSFLAIMPIVLAGGTLATLLYRLVHGKPPSTIAHSTLELLVNAPGDARVWVVVGMAVLAAPIVEEIIYRVLLQSSVRRVLPAWPAILLSTSFFTLVHVGGGIKPEDWHALIPIFLIGAACGIAYEHTRRPSVPILIHILFNAANVTLALAIHP